MATDLPPASAPSRRLPPIGIYLRSLFDLGWRSIPAALPALVFLWFYHFGTGLYLEMAGQGTSPLGYQDQEALVIHALMKVSAYLPLLVLVYTPFLPLQDSLLRGERRSFWSAIRHVLERMVPFVLSIILQILIAFGPVAIVTGILVAVITPLPELPRQVVALIAVATIVPLLMWLFLSGFFLVFAIPGVVLSGLGPARSIATSVRLVASHFWGLLGRFLVFFFVLFAAVLLLSIPTVILGAAAAAFAGAEPALRLAGVLWTSLVTAITFPFWVGSLLVLYRALVPSEAPDLVAADAGVEEPGIVRLPADGGEHATPFRFE